MRISIPDDAPPVLASQRRVARARAQRAELDYHDTLPGTEDRLIERIGAAERRC